MAGNVDLKYNCFLAKMRQEVVLLTNTINYLTQIRDEIEDCLEKEEEEEA